MAQYSATLNVMMRAAEKAGRGLARDFGEVENLQTSKKGPGDFVSVADTRAEKVVIEELSQARPEYGFICEESGTKDGRDPDYRWIIDPLDGTTNFLHGIPVFGVSIALQKGRDVIAGVVYNPVMQEMYVAERGAGAYLNDRRIRVSGRTSFADSVYACGLPTPGKRGFNLATQEVLAVIERSSGVRRMGAAALDLAYVAAGRMEGYWERNVKTWDVAAGIIIVREAGGTVETIEGKGDPVDGLSILATNESTFRPLRKVLKEAAEGIAID